jgi:UDP-N-acetylmuramoylalanine--D-glutamate ligase
MNLKDVKHIVVLGGGESGSGAALLAKKKGFDVFVSDFGKIKDNFKKELQDAEIPYEEEKHTEDIVLNADLVIKSPGIPDKAEIILKIKEKNIPIISEIEFGGYFTNAKIISITGSNGKTTTTMLTYHILKNAGYDVAYGGNVGVSLARRLVERDYDYFVLEISSFQLDYMFEFKSNVAILLNITPDHLDRYEYKMDLYAKSKFRLTQPQTKDDIFIYCQDDPVSVEYFEKIGTNAQVLPITQENILNQGAFLDKENIKINYKDIKLNIDMNILTLVGKHNRYNSMAASIAATAVNVSDDIIRQSLSNFNNIEHRLEHVAKIHGKEFINDSKATNLNATWYALECMSKPVIWIAGGIDKGNDYNELLPLVKQKVKAIVCLGIDNEKIINAFDSEIEHIFNTVSMREAVEISYKIATEDNVILLSPACASFDLFKNYEDRGTQFKDAVRDL